MTDRQQPHPQRCETCTNCNQKKIHARYDKFDTYEFFCNKYQVWVFGTAYNTLEIVGCASHSIATEPAPLCECTHIPTQEQFIAEFVGNEQRKRDEHDAAIAQAEREKVMAPLKVIEEQFGHLDVCLGDHEWCAGNIGYEIAGEMWRAIKESLREGGGK